MAHIRPAAPAPRIIISKFLLIGVQQFSVDDKTILADLSEKKHK
ncbi:MAG: hypothetical protein P8I76_07725 [Woeseiaceae bacterium]|nr:hypothetical protein [Woeseiaceae bacterium]